MFYLETMVPRDPAMYERARIAMGAVYVVRDDRSERVKIGYTRDVLKRLSSLQVGSSQTLRLFAFIAGDRQVEKTLHGQFAEWRIHGEWFDDQGEAITRVIADMTAGHLLGKAVWRLVPGRSHIVQEGGWTRIYWEPCPSADWLLNEELKKREGDGK